MSSRFSVLALLMLNACSALQIHTAPTLITHEAEPNSKQILADKPAAVALKIPRVLHRLWGMAPESEVTGKVTSNGYICARFVSKVRNAFLQSNPKWQEWVWTKKEINALVKKLAPEVKHFPGLQDLRALYDSLGPWVKQSDVARYMIMYSYGGLYLDMDVECTAPMDKYFQEALLYLRPAARNHILASVQGNVFWLKVLARIAAVQAGPDASSISPVRHTGENALMFVIGNQTQLSWLGEEVIVNSLNGKDPNPRMPKACIHWKAHSWGNSWRRYGLPVQKQKKRETENTCVAAFEGAISGQSLALKAGLGHDGSPIALQARQRGPRTSNLPSMVAVVNNFENKKKVDWISSVMRVESVGIHGYPRRVSEAGPWLEWIDENWDNIPQYVAFLHGDERSWHAKLNASEIRAKTPQTVEMLAKPICRRISDFYHGGEKSLIDVVFPALFGKDLPSAWDEWGMAGNKCCSEMVVSREAIRKNERGVYKALIQSIKAHKNQPWGYVNERLWQPLFQQHVMTTGEVEAGLAKLTPTSGFKLDSSLEFRASAICKSTRT